MNPARFLWWIRMPLEGKAPWLVWLLSFAAALLLLGFMMNLVERGHWALTGYAVITAASVLAFRSLSKELGQLARNETLRLLPRFPASLLRGVLCCHALVCAAGALLSLSLHAWLPLFTAAYAAAVSACLILPVASSARAPASNKLHLEQLSADHVSWTAMLALVLPAPALQIFGEPAALIAMAGLTLLLLLALPHRLAHTAAPRTDARNCSVWRKPSMAVFGYALLLATQHFLPAWNSGRNSFLLFAAIPLVGLTALGREAGSQRALLGRMWLAGMSRRQLCLHAIARLSLALGKELAIYFGVLLAGYALGLTQPQQLLSTGFMVLTFGLVNGLNGLEEILHGRPAPGSAGWAPKKTGKFLAVMLPYVLAAALCMGGYFFSPFGALALIALLAGLAWFIGDNLRRFETAELW